MGGLEELMMLRSFLGGGGTTWLSVIMLLSLIGVCVFKPERITSRGFFRWAYVLFGLSIITSSMNYLVPLLGAAGRGMSSSRVGSEFQLVFLFCSAAHPVLLGFSIIMFIAALSPFRKPKAAPPPQPHPLD